MSVTIRQIAAAIHKPESTVYRWRHDNPDLYAAAAMYAEGGDIQQVRAERDAAVEQAAFWREQFMEARADDRQAMAYLQGIREAVGHEGDFPSLVELVRKMAQQDEKENTP